jgi:hypothetical protein
VTITQLSSSGTPGLNSNTAFVILGSSLYIFRVDHTRKNSSIEASGISHRGQVTWLSANTVGVWRHCACAEVCLPSCNLETVCITPLLHCRCVYYSETADSVAQTFLLVVNTPQYQLHLGWLYKFTIKNWKLKLITIYRCEQWID